MTTDQTTPDAATTTDEEPTGRAAGGRKKGRGERGKAARNPGRRAARKAEDKAATPGDEKTERSTHQQVVSLRKRIKELEESNKRLSQVTDAMVEVLLPATEGTDQERLHKVLTDYHQPA